MFNQIQHNTYNPNPDDPDTWVTKRTLRINLRKWAEAADWEGDTAKAKKLWAMLEALPVENDHELEVPF